MSIGVSYDDFWHGPPEMVDFAIKSSEITQKNEAILADVAAWNIGRYVMLGTGVILSQAFNRRSTVKYPQEPMLAYELDESLKEQKRERELHKAHADFLALAQAMTVQKQNSGVGT